MLSALTPDLPAPALATILAVLATAALVSGMSGFGFSAVGAAILALLPPGQGVPLLMVLSAANQMLSLRQLRREMAPLCQWWPTGPGPYLAGGLLGVPCGLWLLAHLPAGILVVLFGALLSAYAALALFRRGHWRVPPGGWRTRVVVGWIGGAIGGFTAFPGAALVVWQGLVDTPKETARATTQPYILGMQVVGLVLLAASRPETFDPQFLRLLALCLPVVLPCTLAGVAIYRRMSDRNFRQITLMLLAASGIGLLGRSLFA
ncbi:MAG: sulfite exporter TauE/SafE family protein [Burkholderiales bacterium]|nr:sulfite exporter TauE/SafE family protein [Burkholderiales bacterium]